MRKALIALVLFFVSAGATDRKMVLLSATPEGTKLYRVEGMGNTACYLAEGKYNVAISCVTGLL